MVMDRKRMTVILRSALLLVTALLILSVILNPVVTGLLFVAGFAIIGVLVGKGRRSQPVRIRQRNVRSVPPGRSPPFFS
jgi:hypothetical protein